MKVHTEIYNKVDNSFSVNDLYIPLNQLKMASNKDEAVTLHEHFDVVPLQNDHLISHYFHKDQGDVIEIKLEECISSSTSLFQLPALFLKRDYYFVLKGNELVGFIHFSDLNNPSLNVAFYTMINCFERVTWDLCSVKQIDINVLSEILTEKRFNEVKENYQEQVKYSVDKEFSNILYLIEIFKLGNYLAVTDLFTDKEMQRINEIRNRIMHTHRALIEKKKDINLLITIINLFDKFEEIINNHHKENMQLTLERFGLVKKE